MKALAAVLALALAGLWAWALVLPAGPAGRTLSDRYVGRYEFFDFVPEEGSRLPGPLRRGQRQVFEFRPDASYVHRILVTGGYEMNRTEGLVHVDGEGLLVLQPVSENREVRPNDPQRFRIDWELHEEHGEVLVLTGTVHPHAMKLRPLPAGTAGDDDGPS